MSEDLELAHANLLTQFRELKVEYYKLSNLLEEERSLNQESRVEDPQPVSVGPNTKKLMKTISTLREDNRRLRWEIRKVRDMLERKSNE